MGSVAHVLCGTTVLYVAPLVLVLAGRGGIAVVFFSVDFAVLRE